MRSAQKEFEARAYEAKQTMLYLMDRLDVITAGDVRGNWGYHGSMGHVLSLLREAAVVVDGLHDSIRPVEVKQS